METTKSDEQIVADFMGINVRYHGPVLYRCDEDGYTDFIDGADTYSPNLNWSDLMPVVEKISDIDTRKFDGNLMAIARYESVTKRTITESIDVVYSAVLAFIKWYNQQTVTPRGVN